MISFLLPIYKQEHFLEKGVQWLHAHLENHLQDPFEIIICDDGSPDRCLTIAQRLAEELANVVSIGYPKNKGRGHALKYAGLRAKGEFLICMDCDLLQEPNAPYIDEMIVKQHDFDIIIASRFHPEAQTKRKLNRMIVSKCYRILVACFFRNFKVTDPDVGFKGFRKDVFIYINLITNLNGPSWDLQFLINAFSEGCRITEIPFSYEEDYERTTVGIIRCSLIEFLGLLYVRFTRTLNDHIIF